MVLFEISTDLCLCALWQQCSLLEFIKLILNGVAFVLDLHIVVAECKFNTITMQTLISAHVIHTHIMSNKYVTLGGVGGWI